MSPKPAGPAAYRWLAAREANPRARLLARHLVTLAPA